MVDEEGRVLWGRNVDRPVAIASATKIVTALVVRNEAELDDEVQVSESAAATPGGKLSLVAGQRATVEDLLWGMLLNSSNDAAVALAEHVAGTEATFAALMGETAAALGADDSRFVTAHGLDAPGHFSTARDLATVAAELLRDPVLAEMVSTFNHDISLSGQPVSLENTNLLLQRYRGAIGVKTGFTSDAGNVLVAAAQRRGRTLISVALGSIDHFTDSERLLDRGFSELNREVLVAGDATFGMLFSASGGGTLITADTPVRGLRPQAGIEIVVRIGAPALPLSGGETVGRVEVISRGRVLHSLDARAADPVESDDPPVLSRALAGLLRTVATIIPGDDI